MADLPDHRPEPIKVKAERLSRVKQAEAIPKWKAELLERARLSKPKAIQSVVSRLLPK